MYILTLICLSIFYYGVRVKRLHLAAFLVSIVVIISIIVVLDVKANSLEQKDPELLEAINKEW
jgi:hypothetical protein